METPRGGGRTAVAVGRFRGNRRLGDRSVDANYQTNPLFSFDDRRRAAGLLDDVSAVHEQSVGRDAELLDELPRVEVLRLEGGESRCQDARDRDRGGGAARRGAVATTPRGLSRLEVA